MKNNYIVTKYNEFIKESSFYDYKNDDILTDKYIKDFIENEDASTNLLDFYIEFNNLDDDDKETIKSSQDYYDYIEDILRSNLEDAKENIDDKIDYHSYKITLYRAITVDDNWLHHLKTQGKRLGIYWSWDENGAETHWGDPTKRNVAVIEIEIDEKYVNWKETFELNIHPYYFEEKEIRLFKNTPIKIKNLKINNVKVDISTLENKVFYS